MSMYEDLSLIFERAQRIFILIIIIFVVLVLYFWKIQILDYAEFWNRSEENRIREKVIPPHRGLLLDRNNRILADNIGSFKASIIRENCEDYDKSYQKISQLLTLEPEIVRDRIEKYESLPEFIPIVVKDDLSNKEIAMIEARKQEMPELIIQTESKRRYPFGTLASHVIGYMLEISPEELRSDKFQDRRLGDLIGKTGIERQYENSLVGKEGQVLEVVDSLGRGMGEIAQREAIPGENVQLTLDINLQRKSEELLEGREGAIIALDPRTGEVLALASYPNFDPNKFINRFSPEEWLELVQDPNFPLENRAIRGLYSPGSIFKIAVALGALESDTITENSVYSCLGSIQIYRRPRACWYAPGHGVVNLYSGIEKSCNIYFYQLGKKMGIEQIAHFARMLSLGKVTGIDLPGEKQGLIPDPEWKKKVRGLPWFPGETISVAIGQGPLLVSPLQVAVFTALVANRGLLVKPHLLKSINGMQLAGDFNDGFNQARVAMKESVFEKVIRGMWLAVNGQGTSRGARIRDFDVCGKTGSTQVVSKETAEKLEKQNIEIKTHSWFSGFAPRVNPRVVVTVLVEYGGGGGATAAPLARQLFELYRENYD